MSCPISGKPCHKHKAFHVTEKSADKIETYLVCEDCLYLSTMNEFKINQPSGECPSCGLKMSDILSGSRMGCMKCYTAFEDTMMEIIKKVQQNNLNHIGHIPESYKRKQAEEMSLASFVEELNAKINKAVNAEMYESAALLKNKMEEFAILLRQYKEEILADENRDEKKAPALRQGLSQFIYDFNNSI